MEPIRVRLLGCLLLAPAVLAGGCVTQEPPPAEFEVPPGSYAAAFEAAQSSLRDLRFDIDRVDARAGVITTQPKTTGGLGTIWDQEQSTPDQEWEDFVNLHDRRVRVTFEPLGGEAEPPAGGQATTAAGAGDVRAVEGVLICRIEVVVDRTRRPGWQIDPTAIMLSSHSSDPELVRRGMEPSYTEPLAEDRFLAARLARTVERRIGAPAKPEEIPPASRGD